MGLAATNQVCLAHGHIRQEGKIQQGLRGRWNAPYFGFAELQIRSVRHIHCIGSYGAISVCQDVLKSDWARDESLSHSHYYYFPRETDLRYSTAWHLISVLVSMLSQMIRGVDHRSHSSDTMTCTNYIIVPASFKSDTFGFIADNFKTPCLVF